jgi:hypothetical protein
MPHYYRLSYTTIDAAGDTGRRVSYLRVPSAQPLSKLILNQPIRCGHELFELTDITLTLIQLDSTDSATLYEIGTLSDPLNRPIYILGSPDQVNLLNSSTQPVRSCRVIDVSVDESDELVTLMKLLAQVDANIKSSREIIWTCQEIIATDETTKEFAQNQLSRIFREQLRRQCPRCQRVGDHWRELDHGGYYECPTN